jgi:hypothetical protein
MQVCPTLPGTLLQQGRINEKFPFLIITLALATEKPIDFRPLRGPENKNVIRI